MLSQRAPSQPQKMSAFITLISEKPANDVKTPPDDAEAGGYIDQHGSSLEKFIKNMMWAKDCNVAQPSGILLKGCMETTADSCSQLLRSAILKDIFWLLAVRDKQGKYPFEYCANKKIRAGLEWLAHQAMFLASQVAATQSWGIPNTYAQVAGRTGFSMQTLLGEGWKTSKNQFLTLLAYFDTFPIASAEISTPS